MSTQAQCDIQKMENKNREKAEINTVNGSEKSSECPGETHMTGLDDSKRRNKTRQMMAECQSMRGDVKLFFLSPFVFLPNQTSHLKRRKGCIVLDPSFVFCL